MSRLPLPMTLLRSLAVAFLWMLVPFLFYFWDEKLALEEDLAAKQSKEIETLEEYARRFPGKASIEKLLYASLAPVECALDLDDQESQKVFARQVASMKARFPGVYEFAYFDSGSRFIASLSDLPDLHPALASMGIISKNQTAYLKSATQESKRVLIDILGPFAWNHPTHRRVLRGFFGPKRAFVGFSQRVLGRPWFYAWMTLPEDFETLAHRSLQAFHHPPDPDGKQGIIDLAVDLDAQASRFGVSGQRLQKALEALGTAFQRVVSCGGSLWIQLPVTEKKRFLICVPSRSEERGLRRMNDRFITLGGVFLLGGGLLGCAICFLPPLSLRHKLLFLFVSAVIVPMCPFVFSVWRVQSEERQVLEERELQNHEEIQREYFRRTIDVLSLLELFAGHLLGGPLPPDSGAAERQARVRFQQFQQRFPAACTVLFASGGQSISNFSNGHMELFQRSMPFIGLKIARTCAEYNGKELSPQVVAREQALKASLETIGLDLDQLMAVFDEPPNLAALAAMDDTTGVFLRFHFSDLQRVLQFVAFVIWGDAFLHDKLPYDNRERFQRILSDHTLLVANMIRSPVASIPASLIDDFLQAKLGLEWNEVRPIHQIEERDGHRWLLSFLLGGLGTRESSVLVSSDEKIQKALHDKGLLMGLMTIPLLLLGIAMGTWMGRSFLRPVQRLSEGMAAIDRREFGHRVPVLGDDEMARLSQTFNLMMEGLEDLEVGKIVQSTFFPTGGLRSADWTVFGSSQPAANVGGDYFDYVALPDGRWLIVIGDATGHGVSAGLIVAMAKAVSHHPLAEKIPHLILNRLNRVLSPTLQRRWMMTCFIALFDPATGTFEASNAGHNYPWLVREASVQPIEITNFMLGAKANLDFSRKVMTLSDADWVCFYTDGLTESVAHDGKIIGPDRLRETLPRLLRNSAEETHQAIMQWYAATARDRVLQDDVTLVILQKTPRP